MTSANQHPTRPLGEAGDSLPRNPKKLKTYSLSCRPWPFSAAPSRGAKSPRREGGILCGKPPSVRQLLQDRKDGRTDDLPPAKCAGIAPTPFHTEAPHVLRRQCEAEHPPVCPETRRQAICKAPSKPACSRGHPELSGLWEVRGADLPCCPWGLSSSRRRPWHYCPLPWIREQCPQLHPRACSWALLRKGVPAWFCFHQSWPQKRTAGASPHAPQSRSCRAGVERTQSRVPAGRLWEQGLHLQEVVPGSLGPLGLEAKYTAPPYIPSPVPRERLEPLCHHKEEAA